jgi:hypothetical protein
MASSGQCFESLVYEVRAAVLVGQALIRAGRDVLVSGTRSTPMAVRTAATSACVASDEERDRSVAAEVSALVYELLDAHADTADLAAELPRDPRWAAHLEHLRTLQRRGREALAHPFVEDLQPPRLSP